MADTTVAATQMACTGDPRDNLSRAEGMVREAAKQGAQIVLLQELFENLYFCPEQSDAFFALAQPLKDNVSIARFSKLAADLGVVIPFSFFERANNAYFNSLVVIDADGEVLDCYRKTHIPDGPGYQEKFYFSPGNTGFRVWQTKYAKIGAAICWDQWFPESARVMAIKGAEIIFYPTAIGNHPMVPEYDSKDTWQRAMQGHAACNALPIVAANRIGCEHWDAADMTFYGSSFITDNHGSLLVEASRDKQEVITASFDLEAFRAERASWGFFRDRRPQHYQALLSVDGFGH